MDFIKVEFVIDFGCIKLNSKYFLIFEVIIFNFDFKEWFYAIADKFMIEHRGVCHFYNIIFF